MFNSTGKAISSGPALASARWCARRAKGEAFEAMAFAHGDDLEG